MYISLKWKAVAFLSFVLVSMTAIWVWQSVDKQLDTFRLELRKTHSNNAELFSELIRDNNLRLSQFSQLISGKLSIINALAGDGSKENIQRSIDRDWLSYSINLSVNYLTIYNANDEKLAEVGTTDLVSDTTFTSELDKAAIWSGVNVEPTSYIYCRDYCLLVVIEPFITVKGNRGTVAIAQNMADLVRVFNSFTGSSIGILIDTPESGKNENSSRYLEGWGAFVWAMSDFNNLFPVLESYAMHYQASQNVSNTLFKNGNQVYQFKLLNLEEVSFRGISPSFISVINVTTEYQLLISNIIRGSVTGLLGLILTEIVLLFLIAASMKRLETVTEALLLLPSQDFNKIIDKVRSKSSYIKDEITTLQYSTAYVAEELEKLHSEIGEKNRFLNEKVDALTRSRSFLNRLFDNSQIFIITQDFDCVIQSTNKKFQQFNAKCTSHFNNMIDLEGEEILFLEQVKKLKDKSIDMFQQEIHIDNEKGNTLSLAWTHSLVVNESGDSVILSIGMDQTSQKNAENNLRWMAHNDSLTNIGNRRWFSTVFADMLASEVSGALVFIDVNRFKQINDIYGHNFGDQVLINIASKLRKLTRESDVICRYAGDEFTVLLTNISQENLSVFLEKLSEGLIGSLKTGDGKTAQYSTSIGASLFPKHGDDPQTLIIHADMAMYHAKKKGLGHWHIFDTNDEQVAQLKNENKLILTIKNALKTDSFTLRYQPILDIKNNSIVHYEALVRMFDENGDIVSPVDFIPLAEKCGEIRPIDDWVFEHALEDLSSLLASGRNICFSINVSAPTLQSTDFPDFLYAKIKKHGVDPAKVMIEITETAYIDNFGQVLTNLKHISKYGVKIALDDFGVGFSSFTYLKLMPLDYVKLDGSYIRSLVKNPDDKVFVKSMTAMINAFGMKTVAEFVEDKATLDLLESLGVSHGQGYFIGKPDTLNSIFLA